MKPDQPAESVYRISLPTPFPVGPVNAYVLPGDPLTLVDAGARTEQAAGTLRAGLEALGVQLHEVEQIVLTHHHLDHCGLVHLFPNAHVVAHAAAVPWLEDGADGYLKRTDYFAGLFRGLGVPEQAIEALGRAYFALASFAVRRTPDQLIADGDQLEAGGRRWNVLHVPGHAGSQIVLIGEDGLALAGDHLIDRISSNALIEPPPPGSDERPRPLLAYLRSLKRFAERNPRLVLAGHSEPITQASALVEERLRMHRHRRDRLAQILSQRSETVWTLCQELFPRLAAQDLFLGLSEVLGHLDWLEAEGVIRARADGRHLRYERIA